VLAGYLAAAPALVGQAADVLGAAVRGRGLSSSSEVLSVTQAPLPGETHGVTGNTSGALLSCSRWPGPVHMWPWRFRR
jgi:hypothetical protein